MGSLLPSTLLSPENNCISSGFVLTEECHGHAVELVSDRAWAPEVSKLLTLLSGATGAATSGRRGCTADDESSDWEPPAGPPT